MNFLVGKRCLAVVFRCMYRKSQLRRRADRGKRTLEGDDTAPWRIREKAVLPRRKCDR
jgi:hypothetical protein